MKKHLNKSTYITAALAIILPLLTGCSEMPDYFPEFDATSVSAPLSSTSEDRTVDFYFDNTSNLKAIRYQGKNGDIGNFFTALFNVNEDYHDHSEDFCLQIRDSKYIIESLKDESTIREEYTNNIDDSFYLPKQGQPNDSALRKTGGILKLMFDNGNSSQANMNHINVVFTDLSEPGVADIAKKIYTDYLSKEQYAACMYMIKAPLKEEYDDFYVAAGNNTVKLVDDDHEKIDTRPYYLLVLGPTVDVANYIDKLESNLQELKVKYESSSLGFEGHRFDIEKDLVYSYASSEQTEEHNQSTNNVDEDAKNGKPHWIVPNDASTKDNLSDNVFRNHTIRLIEKGDYRSDFVSHFEFSSSALFDADVEQCGYPVNPQNIYIPNIDKSIISFKDYSICAHLNLQEAYPDKNVFYVTTKVEYSNNTESTKNLVFSPVPGQNPNVSALEEYNPEKDRFFTLGTLENDDIKLFTTKSGEWVPMDNATLDRMFKYFSTENRCVSLISNSTYEGTIDTVLIGIPVYELGIIPNYPDDWVDKYQYNEKLDDTTSNGHGRYTADLRQFYSNLFNVDLNNKPQNIAKDSCEVKYKRNIIGYIKIMLSEI